MMEMLDPQSLSAKIFLIVPALVCLMTANVIKKVNYNIKAENKNLSVRKLLYIERTYYLALATCVPFVFSFVLSYIIKDMAMFSNVMITAWLAFFSVLVGGMALINTSVKI